MKLQTMSGVMAALVFTSCGLETVGSRYVKQQNVRAGEAAVFSVDSTQSAELNGTRLELPAGALASDTTITLELGLTSILGAELSAGPAAVFGPAGTLFSADVTLVLPVRGLAAGDDVGIVGLAADGTSFEVDESQVALDATRTRATFRIRQLANYQPRRRVVCQADSDCAMGLRCVNAHCRAAPPPTSPDAGSNSSCPMTCPSGSSCDPMRQVCVVQPTGCTNTMNCPTNFACVNGACVPPVSNTCGPNTPCPMGQACLSALCFPVPTDGGSSNPNACMADSDCTGGVCVNGACRNRCLGTVEVCNNRVDDDCDGLVDEGCMNTTPDAGLTCGGFAGIQCPNAMTCIDDPNDNCVPNMGADCNGICVAPAMDAGMNTPVDGGSGPIDGGMAPTLCRSNADCMGTTCQNGVCR